jgi:trans-aconitate 2-methyltransferase
MINMAKSSFPEKDYRNLSFQLIDARRLTFREEFERVFSNAALHWILDQKTVLQGVQRSLKAGGRLLFQMAGKGNAKDILGIIDQLFTVEPWKKFFTGMTFPYGFYDTEEYRTFLDDAGLVPERVELVPKDMRLNGAEGLAGWIRTTWLPFTDKLPAELRQKFIKEIVNRYLQGHPIDDAGIVHVGMMRIEVEACKL